MTARSAMVLVALAACANGAAPAAPMVPATELPPGHTADAGDASDASDAPDAPDASDDDDGGSDPACANAAHSLKMPTVRECIAMCAKLPAKPQPGCMTREACRHRCYATFGPM